MVYSSGVSMPTVLVKSSPVAFSSRASASSIALVAWKYSSAPAMSSRGMELFREPFLW